jgi:peptide/nickel transport system substrate-binding protein
VYEGLVKPDTDGSLKPAVAESYTIEQNGLLYVFRLRKGIKFHNGADMKPEDVAFTLNSAVKAGFTGFTQVSNVEIRPDGSIAISLKAPENDFLPYLTLGIVPADNPDREKNPIGTGPFAIESYAVQRSLTLVKNPNYRQPGLPHLDRVTYVFTADSDALLLALQAGSVDAANITGSLVQQLDPARFDIVSSPSNAVQLMALNNEVKPLDNLKVRLAINYVIDIPEIIDAAFYGRGEPSGSPIIPALSRYYEAGLVNPYPVDTEKARTLLAEAGYAGGFPLEIIVPSNYIMHVDTAQVIVNQLRKIGISANIKLVDWATWLSDVYRGRKYEATIISLDASNISPRTFLSRYRSNGGSNFLNFKNEEFDRVYDEIVAEPDDDKRIVLYKRAQRIISDNAAAVYIQDIYNFSAFTKGRYGGIVNYPLYVFDFAPVYRIQ